MKQPMRFTRILVVAAALAAATSSLAAQAAHSQPSPFRIKPPEMSIPAGTKPGALRRIIQPFGPWTLICDENLKTRKRVCNVSQTLVDAAGQTVFSWSLAASQGGGPVFILRLPAALAGDHFAQVVLGDPANRPVEAGVILSSCDINVCLGFLPVDARLQKQIDAQAGAQIRVRIGPSVKFFESSLEGLGQAVASLK